VDRLANRRVLQAGEFRLAPLLVYEQKQLNRVLQGDREAELGLPISPLCDRKNTMVAESQIGTDALSLPVFSFLQFRQFYILHD
jgi:hypothetical protein